MGAASKQPHRAESACLERLTLLLMAILGTAAVLVYRQHFQDCVPGTASSSIMSRHLRNKTAAARSPLSWLDQLPTSQKGVPPIIHQNYLAGSAQLLRAAMRPGGPFRKEWWNSCTVHHPGWSYMLWDKSACEQLLRERYPWFLHTWEVLGNGTNSVVLQSDAIRPFILHAYGGVYLDLDTECFSNMQPWLEGAQLVFMAENPMLVNNAQMASSPGHPFWQRFFKVIQANAATGLRKPLNVAGPHALTPLLRNVTNNAANKLPGVHKAADGYNVTVYGPQQWFSPCNWNEEECHLKLVRNKPAMLADSRRASAKHAAPSSGLSHPAMLGVKAIAGVHRFSGSWLGSTPGKAVNRATQGVLGVIEFLNNSKGDFVETSCQEQKTMGLQAKLEAKGPAASTLQPQATVQQQRRSRDLRYLYIKPRHVMAANGPYIKSSMLLPTTGRNLLQGAAAGDHASVKVANATSNRRWAVCWDPVKADLSRHSCLVYIIRLTPSAAPAATTTDNGTLSFVQQLAGAGCEVHLITPEATNLRMKNVTVHRFAVGTHFDPFADPPVHTMDSLRDELGHLNKSLTLVHLDDVFLHNNTDARDNTLHAGSETVVSVFNSLYVGNSRALAQVQLLHLEMHVPQRQDHHKAYAMYQHIYQELGFVGYNHRRLGCDGHVSTGFEACYLQLGLWNQQVH